jgi:hypothetical protein
MRGFRKFRSRVVLVAALIVVNVFLAEAIVPSLAKAQCFDGGKDCVASQCGGEDCILCLETLVQTCNFHANCQ